MRLSISKLALAVGLGGFLVLSGCKSDEERAEAFYQSGLELLAAGDEERAQIELRNVFKYNGFHREARMTYAGILLSDGDFEGAYSQYLRVVEQFPDLLELRLTVAELSIQSGNWNEVRRHGDYALNLAPDNQRAKAIGLALAYQSAVELKDPVELERIGGEAQTALDGLPDSGVLLRIVVDNNLRGPNPVDALPFVERAIALEPNDYAFQNLRLSLLINSGKTDDVDAQLRTMAGLFPDNEQLKSDIVRWHVSNGEPEIAEAFLRNDAGALTEHPDRHLALLDFIKSSGNVEGLDAELQALIDANAQTPVADLYEAYKASLAFEAGQQSEAIATMTTIVEAAEPSDQTRNLAVMLAGMLNDIGDIDRAKVLIDGVLTADPANVGGLKLQATWAINEDRPGDAIMDLRAAQNQAPLDPQIMTLLAVAHERSGSRELSGEQLALAVQASGAASDESLRYAEFLNQEGRTAAAEVVLTDALRTNPNDINILASLAKIYLSQSKWGFASEIENKFRDIGSEDALRQADELRAATLMGQDRIEEGLGILESAALEGRGDSRSAAVVVTTQIRAGRLAEARTFLNRAIEKQSADKTLLLLRASLDDIMGDPESAEASYRLLLADPENGESAAGLLVGLLITQDRRDDAKEVLVGALGGYPNSMTLLFLQAGILEQDGDFEGAIGAYEHLYRIDNQNIIISNNLASMLSNHREDADSLARAYTISRRLQGLETAAFMDTFGWIEFRRGNVETALPILESAAAKLTGDYVAQFHLGMAYAALDRQEEARQKLELALAMSEGKPFAQEEQARVKLNEINSTP